MNKTELNAGKQREREREREREQKKPEKWEIRDLRRQKEKEWNKYERWTGNCLGSFTGSLVIVLPFSIYLNKGEGSSGWTLTFLILTVISLIAEIFFYIKFNRKSKELLREINKLKKQEKGS